MTPVVTVDDRPFVSSTRLAETLENSGELEAAEHVRELVSLIERRPGRQRVRPLGRSLDLYERIAINAATGCWDWLGYISPDGYGRCKRAGRGMQAHRFVFEELRGEIPAGLDLDHLCRNRRCVNPDHLEPVTRAENSRRGANARITSDQAREIKRSLNELCERYGVGLSTLAHIARGESWKDV